MRLAGVRDVPIRAVFTASCRTESIWEDCIKRVLHERHSEDGSWRI
jgi:hypothetical protein